MKNLLLLTLLVGMASAVAGDKDVPPGLQKKGGLPPGQAKKQGAPNAVTVTNTVTVTNVVNAPGTPNAPVVAAPGTKPVTPTPTTPVLTKPTATTPVVKIDVDQRAKTINTLDNKAAARKAGMEAIARETGVKVATLQTQRQAHEGMGTAGLLVANVIAAKTKKPAGSYLRERMEGKSWERIAAENKVSLADLDAKLARVEAAMASAR